MELVISWLEEIVNQSKPLFALSLMFCFAVAVEAQLAPTFYPPPQPPAPPDRDATLRQLRTSGAKLKENPPAFTCVPLATKTVRFRSSVAVDFAPPPQDRTDWDRFKSDGIYRGFVEARERQQEVDLKPLFNELFSPGARFTVRGWSGLNRRKVALVRSSPASDGDNREATIYVDPNSGVILRIVRRGFEAPDGVASQQMLAGPSVIPGALG